MYLHCYNENNIKYKYLLVKIMQNITKIRNLAI